MQNRGIAILVQNAPAATICMQTSMQMQHSAMQMEEHVIPMQNNVSASSPRNCKSVIQTGNFKHNLMESFPGPAAFDEHIESVTSSSSSSSDDCLDEHLISSAKKRLSWMDVRKASWGDDDEDWRRSAAEWERSFSSTNHSSASGCCGSASAMTSYRGQQPRKSSSRFEQLRKMSKRCTSEDSICCRERKSSCSIPEPVETAVINVQVKCDMLGFGLLVAGESPTIVKLVDRNGPAAVAGLKTGDEILMINEQDVSCMKLERLQEIFRKKFQAAFWNRARQYHLSITVRRRLPITPTSQPPSCMTPFNDTAGIYPQAHPATMTPDESNRSGTSTEHAIGAETAAALPVC